MRLKIDWGIIAITRVWLQPCSAQFLTNRAKRSGTVFPPLPVYDLQHIAMELSIATLSSIATMVTAQSQTSLDVEVILDQVISSSPSVTREFVNVPKTNHSPV